MTDKKETNGEILKRYAREIKGLYTLVDHMDNLIESHGLSGFKSAAGVAEESRGRYVAEIKRLEEIYNGHVIKRCPEPSSLVCPHCGYDGEFDVDKPEHDGFRLMTPVLEPRQVISYKKGIFKVSGGVGDSHDPFTEIAEPYYVECIDGEGKSDEFERALRKLLKGQHLLLCGKCFKNFSAREFVENCIVDYDIDPKKDKWDRR